MNQEDVLRWLDEEVKGNNRLTEQKVNLIRKALSQRTVTDAPVLAKESIFFPILVCLLVLKEVFDVVWPYLH